VAEVPQPSAAELHQHWAKLEDEQHQLAIAIRQARVDGADAEPARRRQGNLLLEIGVLVAAMRDAPATTIEDFIALLDVALEHELDLAPNIAAYGPSDYPIIVRLLRALAHKVPGFEFNSLRRWLSPGQFEVLMGKAASSELSGNTPAIEPVGFGESERSRS
jgi:hypothetical protein